MTDRMCLDSPVDEGFERAFNKILRTSFPFMNTEDLLRRLRAPALPPEADKEVVLDIHTRS